MDSMNARIRKVLAAKLHVGEERIVASARLEEDLGANSLDIVEAIMALEEEFDVNILDADADALKTVRDVVALFEKRVPVTQAGADTAEPQNVAMT